MTWQNNWQRNWGWGRRNPRWKNSAPSWAEISSLKRQVETLTRRKDDIGEKQHEKPGAAQTSPGKDSNKKTQADTASDEQTRNRIASLKKMRQAALHEDEIRHIDAQLEKLNEELNATRPLHGQLASAERACAEAQRRVQRNELHLQKATESLERAREAFAAAQGRLEQIKAAIAQQPSPTPSSSGSSADAWRDMANTMAGMLSKLAEQAKQAKGSVAITEDMYAAMVQAVDTATMAATLQPSASAHGGAQSAGGLQSFDLAAADVDTDAEMTELEAGLAQANGEQPKQKQARKSTDANSTGQAQLLTVQFPAQQPPQQALPQQGFALMQTPQVQYATVATPMQQPQQLVPVALPQGQMNLTNMFAMQVARQQAEAAAAMRQQEAQAQARQVLAEHMQAAVSQQQQLALEHGS